ncbi:MAG TPA: FHA domain-containing protein [Solirubrobacter sp.]|nr:FHA domain-containing protein [Solirubrobacter sp.]
MEQPATFGSRTPEELEQRNVALDRGEPFLLFRDGEGNQRIVSLDEDAEAVTIGRRVEADISLPWDPEASRLHAELALRAGEWTIADDGWSQNGTWVNGLRLAGRRRLADGDLVKIGRTILAFHQPTTDGPGPTMVQGELSATPRFSEQQQRILQALCRPLFADGDGFNPSSDLEVADATGIDVDVVSQELDLLARLFGLEDMPRPERRAEVALLAVRSGLVSADEGGTQAP